TMSMHTKSLSFSYHRVKHSSVKRTKGRAISVVAGCLVLNTNSILISCSRCCLT
ncbi:cobW/HypB/UreG, nucleotide-binding domain protein, partial [Vibrio parahaemolyticus V-223/04]